MRIIQSGVIHSALFGQQQPQFHYEHWETEGEFNPRWCHSPQCQPGIIHRKLFRPQLIPRGSCCWVLGVSWSLNYLCVRNFFLTPMSTWNACINNRSRWCWIKVLTWDASYNCNTSYFVLFAASRGKYNYVKRWR